MDVADIKDYYVKIKGNKKVKLLEGYGFAYKLSKAQK